MSKTFTTDKSFFKRKMLSTNPPPPELAEWHSDLQAFEVDAVRFGNQRKDAAKAKVRDRRRDRLQGKNLFKNLLTLQTH